MQANSAHVFANAHTVIIVGIVVGGIAVFPSQIYVAVIISWITNGIIT